MLHEAQKALSTRESEMLDLVAAWVGQNSYTRSRQGVQAMAQLLEQAMKLPGMSTERRAAGDPEFGEHLIFRSDAAKGSSEGAVLLIGHHDTVFPPGHFEGWRTDGDIGRGPGSLDMKGGLAIMRTVLAALSDTGALAKLPVVMISVSEEELGSPDSRALLEDIARGASCALVFEAGRAEDAIITRRRGSGAVEATATGLAAHAGNHHRDGRNAIWSLARFIDAAQGLTDYDRGVSVNVGTISGGTTKNTVPAEAKCLIDLRFDTASDGEQLVARLHDLARDTALEGTTIVLDGGLRRLPLERTGASAALYEEYASCAKQAGLGQKEAGLIGGGSDANTVSAVGVPAIDGLGPRGSGFHTKDELVELSSFPLKAQALLRFLVGRISS